MFLKPLIQIFVRLKNFCTCVLSEMYTSMEGSCYIENFQFFSNFQWGFKDEDMVCLNVCPLVNSMGRIARWVLRFYYMKCVIKKKQPVDCRIIFGLTEIRPLQLTANVGKHSGPPFLLSETQVLQGERVSMTCHLECQQHGSSRKVTLKSSCGHSMVPTARVYAGLCQEIQTALSVMELGACLHKWGTVCKFQTGVNSSLERDL